MARTGRIFHRLFATLTIAASRVIIVFSIFLGAGLAISEENLALLRERIVAFGQSKVDRAVAEDLAHQTFILISEKYPGLDSLADLVPLAIRIMQFKIMDMVGSLRHNKDRTKTDPVDLPLPDPGPSPYDQLENREMIALMVATYKYLDPKCRRLMSLRYEGKSTKEIQAVMGISNQTTANVQVFRCYRRWRALMANPPKGVR